MRKNPVVKAINMANKIKSKRVRGRVEVLKVMHYRDCPIYIRRYDKEIFTYDLVYNNEIYFGYVVIKERKDKKKLLDQEIQAVINTLWAGAETTIDTKMGIKIGDKERQKARKVMDKYIN